MRTAVDQSIIIVGGGLGGLAAAALPRIARCDSPLTLDGADVHVDGYPTVAAARWIGDELHLPDCVLRVTAPREPCGKFTAIMGYAQAARDMVAASASGFYLAVVQPGTVAAGQVFTLVPGPRGVSVAQAFAAKRIKHLR